MNYHSDKWIMDRVREHYAEALEHFPANQILGIFYQGSGNYGCDDQTSDVDTKCIVVPTLEDLALNRKPVSSTHVRDNNEHIDFKDFRLYFDTFRKQNLNWLEILFTPYAIINPLYKSEWYKLVERREDICHYSPYRTVKSMTGIANNKYRLLTRESESGIKDIRTFGYRPKELYQLVRITEFLQRYVQDELYEDCLISKSPKALKNAKAGVLYKDVALEIADMLIADVNKVHDAYVNAYSDVANAEVEMFLNDVQCNIMKIAMKNELKFSCPFI
jgi:predicted nucleotidyltransferase